MYEQALPKVELSAEDRVKAFHVIENTDAFLTKERWLKGGWHATGEKASGHPGHTECLANFVRRVEHGGNMAAVSGERNQYDDMESVTERVVVLAIQHEFPRPETRHLHAERISSGEFGFFMIEPEHCRLDHGGRCATCRSKRLPTELTVELQHGPFRGTDAQDVIPTFNDSPSTTYEDVQRVVDTARRIVSPPTTVASEVLTEQERIDVELASIVAQGEIDTEAVDRWLKGIEKAGWLSARKARKKAKARRKTIEQKTAAETAYVLREDTNCVGC